MSELIPLREALGRYRQATGSHGNADDWYRQSAARGGTIWLASRDVPAQKAKGRWVVDSADVDAAVRAHREEQARIADATADYEKQALRGERGDTIRLVWGGYRRATGFHFVWSDYLVGRHKSDGSWRCDTCFGYAQTERQREECHTCDRGGSCGGDCTVSAVLCTDCGTRWAM